MIHTNIFSLLLILIACSPRVATENNISTTDSNTTNMNFKIQYEPSVSAPKLYPVEVYRGDFYNENDWAPIPNGAIVEDGWGDNAMNMGESSIIPTHFRITYFSYMENKFYKGDFKLPEERIKVLFKEGMISYLSMQDVTYDVMIVGMAPGGVLVVWMQGDHHQVEIGRYQAVETDMEWEHFISNTGYTREEFVSRAIGRRPDAVENFKKNGLMLGLWDTYRIKYNWRPKFEFPEGSEVGGIDLKMYNGERFFLFGDKLKKDFEKRAITWRINMFWKDETAQGYGADIDFDEAEIFEAYKQIYRNDKEQNAELVFKYNDTHTSLEIYLRSKTEEIELEKAKVKMFKRSK